MGRRTLGYTLVIRIIDGSFRGACESRRHSPSISSGPEDWPNSGLLPWNLLKKDGMVVGAIGVSGGSGDQDHAVAEAGAAAF